MVAKKDLKKPACKAAKNTKAVKKETAKNKVSKKKRVKFSLESERGKKVAVAGSFNNWDTSCKILIDENDEGLYQVTMFLSPGTYEYKYFIDGTWCIDPANPNFSPNNMGTLNSVLVIEE
ncbi:MAG: glycogen-binding domain-containing protein [Victivallales bacterium]|nr:glycogen-binding domain-containing protein [Victivallales bacterium]